MTRGTYRSFAFILLLIFLPISVFAQGGPLRIMTSTRPAGRIGVPYSATVNGAGGVRPYLWTETGLPSGLSIAALTGVISGTPTASGSFTVRVTLRDVILSSV